MEGPEVLVLAGMLFGAWGRPTGAPEDAPREQMVVSQIASRGITDTGVLDAMRRVRRHLFVPESERSHAYEDRPLSIGHDQTISQPYIVAFMTAALGLSGDEKVLEIGTGSGYQAAVLAEIVPVVYSIEIVPVLADQARTRLAALGYTVHVRTGDGYLGWPEQAPFDAIIVTAAPDHVPAKLLEQLAVGGRLVLPLGAGDPQELVRIVRHASGFERETLAAVRFVPMTGEAQERD